MPLDLYSKGTTDTLLAGKLDLSGGTMTGALNLSVSGIIFSDATYLTTAPAGSTLAADQLTAGVVTANPTAGPTTAGDVLQFDGTALIWGPGGGGGGLTISTLSNGATSTLDATVPSAGYVLSFDGTNLIWAAGGGGGGAVWGGITGTVTDQTDLVTYVTGLGYLTDAPSDGYQYCRYNGAWAVNSGFTFSDSPTDGNYYVRMGSTGWAQIGNGTDTIATQNWVTSQGYATTSDVSTAVSGLVSASDARKTALVESFRSSINDAGIFVDGSGYVNIPFIAGALNVPVANSEFSSGGKWFGLLDPVGFSSVYAVNSVTLSSGVVTIVFHYSNLAAGHGLYYTEDGGTTWVESTFKLA
jgi:hypothetical protein